MPFPSSCKTKTGHPTGCPVSFQFSQQLRLARRWAGGRRGRVGHHVVLILTGVGGGVKGLAAAGATFGPGQPAAVVDATLETGLTLPSLVVPVGFGEVRVNVVPAGAGKGEVVAV